IERAFVLSQSDEIRWNDMMMDTQQALELRPSQPPSSASYSVHEAAEESSENKTMPFLLDDVVKSHIIRILEFNKGAKDKTAKMLGIDRKTLYRKLNEYGY